MSENFIVIAENLDVSSLLQPVLDNPDDWKAVSTWSNIAGKLNPLGFLPLNMAVVENMDQDVRDSDLLQPTPFYEKYSVIRNFLRDNYGVSEFARAAFFKLEPGGSVARHIDEGQYYTTKDRFHLSLQGQYLYEVDGEERIIKPGTFFWFDNKKQHSATVVGDEDRITFVFDVPYSPNNPQHHVK